MQDNGHRDTSVLTTMFAHNVWANLKLLDFCEQLSDEQLDTTAIGSFGSIRNTLAHIIGTEVSYVVRVNGKAPPQPFAQGEFPGFAVLKDVARWTNEELLQLALSTREDTIVRERRRRWSAEYRLASLITQVINHATDHRAQISAIITQMGMEPPDMSSWQFIVDIGEFQEWIEETDGA